MTRRTRCPSTADLFDLLNRAAEADALVPVVPETVRKRPSFYARHSGLLKLAAADQSRAEIAEKMSAFLGEHISESYLNAALAEGKPTHVLNSVRYGALVHATQDRRLVQLFADLTGDVVLPQGMMPFLKLGMALKARAEADDMVRKIRGAAR